MTKEQIELCDAIGRLRDLVSFAAGPGLACFAVRAAEKQGRRGTSCLRTVEPEWGRPLTKAEYEQLCPACRAYYYLIAAQTELDDCRKGLLE